MIMLFAFAEIHIVSTGILIAEPKIDSECVRVLFALLVKDCATILESLVVLLLVIYDYSQFYIYTI